MPKSLGKSLEETWRLVKNSRPARFFRRAQWRETTKREQRSVTQLAANAGLATLSTSGPAWIHDNHRELPFFVLGNGASVNALTPRDFSAIQAGVSIGINAWPLHPFTPTYFSFEYGRDSFSPDPELVQLVNIAQTKLFSGEAKGLLFLRPGAPALTRALVPLAAEGSSRSLMYGRANLFAQDLRSLEEDLTWLLKQIRDSLVSPSTLPDNGSSVIRMVFLALILGFRDVVLVGVDLNGSDYFWEEDKFFAGEGESFSLGPRPRSDGTSTESTENRPFPVSVFLAALAPLAERILGARIWCASPSSLLAQFLPIYDFPRQSNARQRRDA